MALKLDPDRGESGKEKKFLHRNRKMSIQIKRCHSNQREFTYMKLESKDNVCR